MPRRSATRDTWTVSPFSIRARSGGAVRRLRTECRQRYSITGSRAGKGTRCREDDVRCSVREPFVVPHSSEVTLEYRGISLHDIQRSTEPRESGLPQRASSSLPRGGEARHRWQLREECSPCNPLRTRLHGARLNHRLARRQRSNPAEGALGLRDKARDISIR